ncbi:L-threonylcarbamoyladenylate synthase [soil metagenome]
MSSEPTRQPLDGNDPAAIDAAARLLADGRLVAFPTETVYGLGARAEDDAAVAKIFAAKGRPSNHPLIVHVHDARSAAAFASHLPAVAQRLMDAFWPGPLTIIVKRAEGMAAASAGGQDSIGLRCPSHPVALALLQACERLGVAGVAAPSANRFGRVSPTRAAHVQAEFGDAITVIDGGDSEIGIESTIVDCSRGRPVLLRPGVLLASEIEAAIGEPLHAPDVGAPRASGTLESHYAPRAKVRLMNAVAIATELASQPAADPSRFEAGLQAEPASPDSELSRGPKAPSVALYSRTAIRPAGAWLSHRVMPSEPGAAAHELFAVLRDFDDQGVQAIWVEEPPPDPGWDGVRDRLRRAAS